MSGSESKQSLDAFHRSNLNAFTTVHDTAHDGRAMNDMALRIQRGYRKRAQAQMDQNSMIALLGSHDGVPATRHGGDGWQFGEAIPVVLHVRTGTTAQRIMSVRRRYRSCGGFACGLVSASEAPMRTVDLAALSGYVKGRRTEEFARTQKFTVQNGDGDLIDLGARSLTLLPPPGGGREINLEFDQLTQRRQVVDYLFTCGVKEKSNEVPCVARRTVCTMTYNVMYSFVMDQLVLGLIMASVVTMAMYDKDMPASTQAALDTFDLVANILFTVEAVARIVAMEGIRPYLRNAWNKLDIFIVVMAWVTEIPALKGMSGFRALRALRALRAIRSMRMLGGLRNVVQTYVSVLPMVLQASCILAYFLFLFATFAVDVFSLATVNKCVVLSPGHTNVSTAPLRLPVAFCTVGAAPTAETGRCASINSAFAAPPTAWSPNPEADNNATVVCRRTTRKNEDLFSYSSIYSAVLTTFRIVAKSPGNTVIVRSVLSTSSYFAIAYYISVVIFLSSVILSVFVAIVRVTFTAVRNRQKVQNKEFEALTKQMQLSKKLHKTMLRLSSNGEGIQGGAKHDFDHCSKSPAPQNRSLDADVEMGMGAGAGAGISTGGAEKTPPAVAAKPSGRVESGKDGRMSMLHRQQSQREAAEATMEEEANAPSMLLLPVRLCKSANQGLTKTVPCYNRICCVCSKKGCFVAMFSRVARSRFLDEFITLAVVVNCVFLAMEHHAMSSDYVDMLGVAEVVFTFLFLAEMIVKIVGYGGFLGYLFKNDNWKWHCFDCFIVCTTCLDLALMWAGAAGLVNLSFLRLARLFRILRLIRKNKNIARIVSSLVNSIASMVYLLLFSIIVMILFAILGMNIFGGQMGTTSGYVNGSLVTNLRPRANFDSFPASMLTLFRMMAAGAPWDVLYALLGTKSSWIAPFFYVAFSIFSSYITLNFLAVIIMSQFAISVAKDAKGKAQLKRKRKAQQALVKMQHDMPGDLFSEGHLKASIFNKFDDTANKERQKTAHKRVTTKRRVTTCVGVRSNRVVPALGPSAEASVNPAAAKAAEIEAFKESSRSFLPKGAAKGVETVAAVAKEPLPRVGDGGDQEENDSVTSSRLLQGLSRHESGKEASVVPKEESQHNQRFKSAKMVQKQENEGQSIDWANLNVGEDDGDDETKNDDTTLLRRLTVPRCVSEESAEKSLWGIKADNVVRKMSHRVIDYWLFETVIIFSIVVSSGLLAMETPGGVDPITRQVLDVFDNIFFTLFNIEFVLKAIALGILWPKKSYFSDSWNMLDFVVLCASLFGKIGGGGGVTRILRLGRVLRPLRMINRNEGMKVVVSALLRSMVPVFYTVCILLLFLFVFGIMGITLFMGKFYKCNDLTARYARDCVGTYVDASAGGLIKPRVWANPPYNFDSIGQAIMTIFEVITLKAWLGSLYAGLDSKGVDMQPEYMNSGVAAWFYVAIICLASMFLFKLFIGIIVGTFRELNGTALLTKQQQRWLGTKQMLRNVAPPRVRPKQPFGSFCYTLENSTCFINCITAASFLHMCVIASQHENQGASLEPLLWIIHWVMCGVYVVDLAVRMFARGPGNYLQCLHDTNVRFWNIADLIVLLMFIILPVIDPSYRRGLGVLRSLRFVRFFNLFGKGLRTVKLLCDVVANSWLQMLNVSALLCLMMYIFAILAMQVNALNGGGRERGLPKTACLIVVYNTVRVPPLRDPRASSCTRAFIFDSAIPIVLITNTHTAPISPLPRSSSFSRQTRHI